MMKYGYTNLCSAKIILSGINIVNGIVAMITKIGCLQKEKINPIIATFKIIDHKNQKRHKNTSFMKLQAMPYGVVLFPKIKDIMAIIVDKVNIGGKNNRILFLSIGKVDFAFYASSKINIR